MTLMFQPLRKYASFSGRARRAEYWLFFLLQVLLYTGVMLVAIVGGMGGGGGTALLSILGSFALIGLIALAMFLPNLAVLTRRLHDINLSALWLCLMLPGIIGQFMSFGETMAAFQSLTTMSDPASGVNSSPNLGSGSVMVMVGMLCNLALFVMMLIPGKKGPNRFGPDPKGGSGVDISVFDDNRIDAAINEAKANKKERDPDYKPVFDFTSPLPSSAQADLSPAPAIQPAARQTPTFGKRR